VLRQRLFELLFDAEGIGGGARPEFSQRVPIALAPEEKSLRVFPTRAEEGDNAVSELAEGHRVEGRGVEPVDDERAVAADPFEAFARRACRRSGSRRRLRAQWMKSANSSSVVSVATVRRMRARSRGL
jgi:hypothetical protein